MARKRKYANNAERQAAYRKRKNTVIIAVDGEGYTLDNEHIYASLFAYNGDKLYEIHAVEYGLSLAQILRFFRDIALENENALWVSFAFSYDVTMIFKELSADEINKMMNGGTVLSDYGVYVEYRYRKQLRIVYNRKLKVTIYDLFGFTATSFVNTAKMFRVDEGVDEIAEGKKLRGSVEHYQIERIREYTRLELCSLIAVFQKIREYAQNTGLTLTRYEGAGSVASALFRANGYNGKTAQRMAIKASDDEIDRVRDRLYRAYYGGRIETLKYGYGRNIVGYDIVSAYPSVTQRLPSLENGYFRYVENPTRQQIERVIEQHDYGVITLKYELPEAYFYPFPYREYTSVYFPQIGYSSVYLPLFKTALKNIPDLWRYITITDLVYLDTYDENERPFQWVNDVFKIRQEMKEKGVEAQLMLKLGLNSLYGKFAQRPIQVRDKLVQGTYQNIFYAGYITASTQAKLLDVAYQKPDCIIAMATDGIYATEALNVVEGKKLGFWEYEEWEEGLFVYSGFYILRNKKGSGKIKMRNRGLHIKNPDQVFDDIVKQWLLGKKEMTVSMTVFHSLRKKKKDDDKVGYFEEIEKVIDLTGGKGKRASIYNQNPATGLCDTVAVGYDYFIDNLADKPRLAVFDTEEMEVENE